MKDIIIRSVSGLVFIGVLIGSILASPTLLGISIGIFSTISLFEFSKMTHAQKTTSHHVVFMLLGVSIFLMLSGMIDVPSEIRLLFVAFPFLILWMKSLWNEKDALHEVTYGSFGLIYCVIPYAIMVWINDFDFGDGGSSYYLLYLFLIVWTNDTFAYLSGRLFGKTKLFERISPKKTWEGSVGGFLFSILVGVLIGYFTGEEIAFWVVSSILISISAVLGDLFESMMKRTVGVKDSGNIMPGHGGILDRFDAAIFAAPVFYVWCFIYFSYQ